jgi:hypothetical protein
MKVHNSKPKNFDINPEINRLTDVPDLNYRLGKARKIAFDEFDRVGKHEQARRRLIQLEQQERVKALLSERHEQEKQRYIARCKKEVASSKLEQYQFLKLKRNDILAQTHSQMRLIESLAVKAAKAHKEDVRKHIDKLHEQQKSNEIAHFNRSLRNQELMEFRQKS